MHIKEILHGSDARLKIAAGVDKAANTIGSTLGPKGRNVIIEQIGQPPRITKDGVSVAKEIHLKDPFENLGAELLAQISHKTCEDAGDGTTTASILAQSIFSEGVKAIQAGMNPVDLKTGIDLAVAVVIEHVAEHSKAVAGEQNLKDIATISANGDEHIGDLLAKAFTQIGEDGMLTLVEGTTAHTSLEFLQGIQMGVGYDSSALSCITHPDTETCEYRDCAIFLHEASFPNEEKITAFIKTVNHLPDRAAIPVLVMADSYGDQIAIPMINANNSRKLTKICPVNLPRMGESERERVFRRDFLIDFAVLTGGKLMKREEGDVFSTNISADYFGYAESIVVSRHKTIIIGGKGDPEAIEEHKINLQLEQKELRQQIDFDRDYDQHLTNRLKNFNGMAIIRAGGTTETEVKERKDRIEDAMHATRASLEEGIVPGGGIALLKSKKAVEQMPTGDTADIQAGINIVYKALSAPFAKIIQNAGKNESVISSKIDAKYLYELGYDAKNDAVVNMVKIGIIDPAKVVRCCIENAASIAGLLLTTDALITYADREINPMANMRFKM